MGISINAHRKYTVENDQSYLFICIVMAIMVPFMFSQMAFYSSGTTTAIAFFFRFHYSSPMVALSHRLLVPPPDLTPFISFELNSVPASYTSYLSRITMSLCGEY